MIKPIMSKVPEFPRVHQFGGSWSHSLESATANDTTILPLVTYDEGLGAMSAFKTNPANASFVTYGGAKCFPTSRINNIFCEMKFNLTKGAIETDKLQTVRFATSTIHTAFMDGELALDEVSTLDLNEIIELQNEQTDRQTFPLYNTIDMADGKLNSWLDLEVGQEGLDTDLEIEGITFQEAKYYDCLSHYTNGNKLRTIMTPLKWHSLSRNHPVQTVYFSQQSNTKYMNPYAFLGAFVHVPANDVLSQYSNPADTTAIPHIQVQYTYRYNEFNHEFNHALV